VDDASDGAEPTTGIDPDQGLLRQVDPRLGRDPLGIRAGRQLALVVVDLDQLDEREPRIDVTDRERAPGETRRAWKERHAARLDVPPPCRHDLCRS